MKKIYKVILRGFSDEAEIEMFVRVDLQSLALNEKGKQMLIKALTKDWKKAIRK